MNHENMRRIVDLEDRVGELEVRLLRLEAQIRARLKEEAEARSLGHARTGYDPQL